MINNIHPSSDTYSSLGSQGELGSFPAVTGREAGEYSHLDLMSPLQATAGIFQNLSCSKIITKITSTKLWTTLSITSVGNPGRVRCKKHPSQGKKEKNARMWRARADEADRYCRPLFFTLWNSDVLPGDWFGRGEMDGNKMGKENMKHARGEHRLGFRVDDSSFLSRWDEDVCPLTRTVYYPLSASITIKSPVCETHSDSTVLLSHIRVFNSIGRFF